MSDERDADLGGLFDGANRSLESEVFVARVMARTRSTTHDWLWVLVAALVAVPLLWLAVSPINEALAWFTATAARPIANVPQDMAPVLSPLNSFAAVGTLAVFVLRSVYRRWRSLR
jgi:hypothetical protein